MMARTNKIMWCRRIGSAVCRTAGGVVLSIAFIHGDLVRADEFQVTLQIQQGKQIVQATSRLPDSEQSKAGANKTKNIQPRLRLNKPNELRPRPVLHISADQTVWVSWQVAETGSSDTFKDLLVHIFATKETKAGQRTVPKLSDLAAYESALTMDFTPKDQAQGQFQLKFDQPGIYLVRAETIGLTDKLGHEFYAAADVEVGRAAMTGP